jgi:hypothetical protein
MTNSRGAVEAMTAVLVATGVLAQTGVAAQDLNERTMFRSHCLLERNDEGRPYFYGQVDKGFLVHNDGDDTNVFPLVDNDNSSTQAGVIYKDHWRSNVTAFANFEIQWTPYASDSVNQLNQNDVDWGTNEVRHAEGSLEVDGFGRFWFGQGSSASDGSAEKDLSGTTVIAYSSIADTAGGQFFAFDGERGLSGVTIGSAFSNLDGQSRKLRLRYDTPRSNGLGVAGSVGYDALSGDDPEDLYWDVAASFARNEKQEDFSYAAGAAFSRSATEDNRFSGSFSVFHQRSKVSLTLAGGYEDRNADSRAPAYGYVKLGYAPELTSLGPTAFSIDFYRGQDFSANGSDSRSYGFAAVQTIARADDAFDIYSVIRLHDYDDPAGSYQDGLSSLTGIRWRF